MTDTDLPVPSQQRATMIVDRWNAAHVTLLEKAIEIGALLKLERQARPRSFTRFVADALPFSTTQAYRFIALSDRAAELQPQIEAGELTTVYQALTAIGYDAGTAKFSDVGKDIDPAPQADPQASVSQSDTVPELPPVQITATVQDDPESNRAPGVNDFAAEPKRKTPPEKLAAAAFKLDSALEAFWAAMLDRYAGAKTPDVVADWVKATEDAWPAVWRKATEDVDRPALPQYPERRQEIWRQQREKRQNGG